MNLVKWFRKNNKKVMAVVVIVIMLGFVGGTYIQQLGRRRTMQHKTVAYFADNKKITNHDIYVLARQELDVLRMLRADQLLRSQDLLGVLLGELLFAEQRTSPALFNPIKQTIRTNQYRISDRQISDMYRRSVPSSVYWLLLKNEAELAGIRVQNEDVGKLLGQAIPQLFNGQTYSQRIGALIDQRRIPEQQILTIFGKLLAVLQYANMICSSEDVTSSQIMHVASRENETMDVEFVEFDSAVFAKTQSQPSEEKMAEHFDKYRKFVAGDASEENPYGFGYKLPDRVQLEYMVVKLEDIAPIITPPTHQEAEEYYQRNREQLFTEQVPLNPNDPNSPLTERIKSYAEVAGAISDQLRKNKINSKTESILQEAKTLTEADLEDINDVELANLSTEQLAEIVGDYETAAGQLSEKHNVKVYAGRTGLLSPIDIQTDVHLATLYLQDYGYNPVELTQIVFAVDELAVSELAPFDMRKKPRMYVNIGPLTDMFEQIMVLIRVIKAEKASEPETINQTFSTGTLEFERDEGQLNEDVYSVKEKVAEDLKKLAEMDTTRSKAEEFIELAAKDGWESASDKFNELHEQQTTQNEGDPNALTTPNAEKSVSEPFKQQSLTNLQRISRATLETLAVQNEGKPAAQFFLSDGKKQRRFRLSDVKKQRRFIDQLYSLLPQDSNTVDTVPLIMEFKPDMSYYCVKNISVKRLGQEEYEGLKAMRLYREDHTQTQSLAAVYLNPENILKRMNFRLVGPDEEPEDANAPTEPEAAL